MLFDCCFLLFDHLLPATFASMLQFTYRLIELFLLGSFVQKHVLGNVWLRRSCLVSVRAPRIVCVPWFKRFNHRYHQQHKQHKQHQYHQNHRHHQCKQQQQHKQHQYHHRHDTSLFLVGLVGRQPSQRSFASGVGNRSMQVSCIIFFFCLVVFPILW